MMNETKTLCCTNCGREIQVPGELTEFSCVYCGAKLRMQDLLPPVGSADERDRIQAEEHLLDCIRDFPNAPKEFTRKKYEACFQAQRECLRPVYEAMDRYLCAQPQRREVLLEYFADCFLEQWDAYHRDHRRSRTKRARRRLEFESKLTLAWYTVPAIRSLDLSVSADFPPVLRDRFVAKYPENRFELGTYEEISGGFRKGIFRR